MTDLQILAVIAAVYLPAAISPGPNFFVISQLSMSGRRRLGFLVALGIVAGSMSWAMLAMAGVAALLAQAGWIYTGIRIAGALYLVWLGLKLLRSARRDDPAAGPALPPPVRPGAAFRSGVLTCLTNPKSGIFWTSIFASVFPADARPWLFGETLLMIACLSACWYLGVALFFASERVRTGYRRLRHPIDAACGALLVAFGLRLAVSR